MPTSLWLSCISRGFQVLLGGGRRKATAICMTKPQHGLPTISDSLPLQHIPFYAISTPPLKKLLETQVPISSAWLLPQHRGLKKQSVCIWFRVHQETPWKHRWEDWPVGVLGQYFQKFHHLVSSALRHKDTEPL